MLTGTARTSVGASPRKKTRDPESAYIARAVPHVLSACCACARESYKGRFACMRVLSTSNGNVTTHPRTPAAPPARSSPAHERCASASVSCTSPGAGCTGAQRRSVASYCAQSVIRGKGGGRKDGHARRRSTSRNRRRRAGSSRRARGRARARRPRGRCALRLYVRARRAHVCALRGAAVASAVVFSQAR
jgi:hypothetical protein